MSKADVSVIVCAHTTRRWQVLQACVGEVLGQLGTDDELLVVVDHCGELLDAVAQRWTDPRLLVLANDADRGLSGARNTGVAAASRDIVAFLDDDAVPRPGWLDGLRGAVGAEVVMVGGAVEPAWEAGAPPWFPDEFGWVVGCDYRGMPGGGAEIRNPIGASMAADRIALAKAGAFSAELGRVGSLPVGCEETEVAIRLRRVVPGSRIVRTTEAVVDHLVPLERGRIGYFLRRCWHEGRSKAALSGLVGAAEALSSERAHARRLVTSSIAREMTRLVRGDGAALARLIMIIVGLFTVTAGFATGRRGPAPAVAAQPFTPLPVVDAEVGALADLTAPAHVVVRERGWPIGQIRVPAREEDDAPLFDATTPPTDASQAHAELHARTRPAVTVVVPTLGDNPVLRATVAALQDQVEPIAEIIVVSNRARPGPALRALIEELAEDPGRVAARVLVEPLPGASRARNAGARSARTPVIAFTDDDAVPDADWTRHLLDVLVAAPDAGGVTSLVVPAELASAEQVRFEEYGGFAKGYELTHWFAGDEARLVRDLSLVTRAGARSGGPQRGYRGAAFPFTATEFGSGVLAVRAETFDAVGGFDVALGPGTPTRAGEDLDLCRSIYLAGRAVVYHPAAVVRHHHRDESAALESQVRGYGIGLTAALTKLMVQRPAVGLGFLAKVPAALRMLFAPDSKKNAALPADFPRALVRAELRGMVAGPLLYLRSHRVARRRDRETA